MSVKIEAAPDLPVSPVAGLVSGLDPHPEAWTTPGLMRRMACFVYEGLLLFGIGLIPGSLGALLVGVTGDRHPLQSDAALRVFTFLLYAVYFVWFWSERGQTLPMQTWHIRVVTVDGRALTRGRALLRFVASCAWFAPAAALATLNHWSPWHGLAAVGIGVLAYASLASLHPQRQFWHDAVCGTRLVESSSACRTLLPDAAPAVPSKAQSAPMTHFVKGRMGIERIVQAAGHSLDGLSSAYRGESAFRQELWAAAVMTPLAFWMGSSWVEIALLLGSVLLVLIVELLNSGIEAVVDRVSLEWHELSKRAKDLASAAVFLSLMMCGGIWFTALWHRLSG